MLNKVLNEQLGWDDPKKALDEHVVHYETLAFIHLLVWLAIE